MNSGGVYKGSCFCGAVQFTVSGKPEAMGYCHCESCRHWSASPVNAFTLWKPEAVQVTSGAEKHRHLQQDAAQLSQMVQNLRRSSLHRASGHGTYGCVRSGYSGFSIPSRHSCQLSGDGTAYERRVAEDEGSSKGNGRLGYQRRGIAYKAHGLYLGQLLKKLSNAVSSPSS